MGNYDWSIEDIKKKIQLIESFEDKEKYRNDIITLNSMINKTIEKRRITAQIEEQLMSKQEEFSTLSKTFISSVEKYKNDIEIPPFRFHYLSDEECLEIVHDFYKTREKYIYDAFIKNFEKRNTNLRMRESLFYSSAVTHHINCLNQSYIDIAKSNSIYDIVNLAHEYGHAIGFSVNNDIVNNEYFVIIDDLEGEYFQLEFINWLIENNIFAEEAVLAKLFINQGMYCKAHYVEHRYDLQKLAYLMSYLTSIELSYLDNKDEILVRLINHKPNSIENMLSILYDYLSINKNAEPFQLKLRQEGIKYFG